jgi:hypothetical protein
VHSTNHRVRTGLIGLIAAVALSIGMPAMAAAQAIDGSTGPAGDQYDPQAVQIETSAGGGDGGGSGLTDPVGPLPFTGFDVIAMLAVALAVTGLGLALQRAVTRQAHDSD